MTAGTHQPGELADRPAVRVVASRRRAPGSGPRAGPQRCGPAAPGPCRPEAPGCPTSPAHTGGRPGPAACTCRRTRTPRPSGPGPARYRPASRPPPVPAPVDRGQRTRPLLEPQLPHMLLHMFLSAGRVRAGRHHARL